MADTPDDRRKTIDRDIQAQQNDAPSTGRSVYTCPDCGGVLWEFDDEFGCHTGHRWSPDALVTGQSREVRESLMAAVRALRERAILLRQTAHKAAAASASGRLLETQADADDRHAALIQEELLEDDPECSTGRELSESVTAILAESRRHSED